MDKRQKLPVITNTPKTIVSMKLSDLAAFEIDLDTNAVDTACEEVFFQKFSCFNCKTISNTLWIFNDTIYCNKCIHKAWSYSCEYTSSNNQPNDPILFDDAFGIFDIFLAYFKSKHETLANIIIEEDFDFKPNNEPLHSVDAAVSSPREEEKQTVESPCVSEDFAMEFQGVDVPKSFKFQNDELVMGTMVSCDNSAFGCQFKSQTKEEMETHLSKNECHLHIKICPQNYIFQFTRHTELLVLRSTDSEKSFQARLEIMKSDEHGKFKRSACVNIKDATRNSKLSLFLNTIQGFSIVAVNSHFMVSYLGKNKFSGLFDATTPEQDKSKVKILSLCMDETRLYCLLDDSTISVLDFELKETYNFKNLRVYPITFSNVSNSLENIWCNSRTIVSDSLTLLNRIEYELIVSDTNRNCYRLDKEENGFRVSNENLISLKAGNKKTGWCHMSNVNLNTFHVDPRTIKSPMTNAITVTPKKITVYDKLDANEKFQTLEAKKPKEVFIQAYLINDNVPRYS